MLSQIVPKNFDEASKNKKFINAMNKELDQIEKNKTWDLTPRLLERMSLAQNGY